MEKAKSKVYSSFFHFPFSRERSSSRELTSRTTIDWGVGPNVKLKDISWQSEGATGIRHINDPTDSSFHWSGAQDDVSLLGGVSEPGQIVDGIQARLAVGDVGIKVILSARVVN